MANASFVDALSNIRRKAQLSGRPLSKQETAGAVAGYADTASQRLARGRSLDLEEKRLEQMKLQDQRQYDLAQERMGQDEEAQAADTSTVVGAGAGYLLGPTLLFGVNPILGAIAGGLLGRIFKKCIIITACEGPESYEVEVSRIYRDKFMTIYELIGYYRFAHFIAFFIERHRGFKRVIKNQLVDRLVDYAEWLFRLKPEMERPFLSKWVTRGFLKFCRVVGKLMGKFGKYTNKNIQ